MSNEVYRKPIEPRPLTEQERGWVQEILESHPDWADVDVSSMEVIAVCGCGKCGTIYFGNKLPQNPRLQGTRGYIGRIYINTTNEFFIEITLDQIDGNISELYVNYVDVSPAGDRTSPGLWKELSHKVEKM